MKKILALILFILILPSILAINLKVEKTSSDEVLIMGLNKPVIINLKITNLGEKDNFMFYTFFGAGMYPKGTIFINKGETKDVEIGIYPRDDFEQRGYVTFDYFIKAQDGSQQEQSLTVKVIDLKDAFEVGAEEFNPGENSIKVFLKNKVNFNFENVRAEFSSPFFDFEENFDLNAKEKKEFDIKVNKDDFKKLIAGFYTLNVKITTDGKQTDVEGIIKFPEKNILTTKEKKIGFIITTEVIKKVNEGNVISESETVMKKNILSRLFTSFNPEPDIIERKGFFVYYTWTGEIKPGETLEITARTNWLFPLLAIFFIITIVILVKEFSKTDISMRKKISFVRAKGSEFALKVSIFVNARKYVERVSIIDRLPQLVKIHERFGAELPKRVDEKNRKIEWSFEKLEAGEVRVLSYIIYSKIGVLGKFALPSAIATYEKDGQIKESQSNRAFFIAEQRKEKED